MGHFWLYFGNFSAGRVRNGPKTWSSVVCTHTDHLLSTVCDFEPSRRRTNFSGGLLVVVVVVVVVVACDD